MTQTPTQNDVPVIDIAPFRTGDKLQKQAVCDQVRDACERIGFLSIVGHGISPDLIRRTRDVSNAFFDLSLEEKKRVTVDATGSGYVGMAVEALAASRGDKTPGDLKESLNAGRDFSKNLLPTNPAALRQTWVEYFAAVSDLANTMMRIFALALRLPENYFADKVDQPQTFMRAINYPEQSHTPEAGQLRAGAHTDYGTLTILLSENKPGGLQVLSKSGEWLDVRAVDNSYVINIGDMMQAWTNDRWISTLHRVTNPPPNSGSTRRLSLVFFHNPNPDAIIAPLATCVDAQHSPKYEPMQASEHLRLKSERAGGLGKK
jgi:isopenicillin N synthase-like dioxygenase